METGVIEGLFCISLEVTRAKRHGRRDTNGFDKDLFNN
jgi:hypothetical protein